MSGLSRYGTAGDVNGFYAALGITLSPRADREAAVACFANPDAHQHGDRHPSCSVNVRSGAWHCHGCGARGGAYDAALIHERTPRQAIDLMIFHGLAERRESGDTDRRRRGLGPERDGPRSERPKAPPPPSLAVHEAELAAWQLRLADNKRLLEQLERRSAWAPEVMARHGLGWNGERVVLPVRDETGGLLSVLHYAPPWRRTGPKIVAVPGSRRGLFPSPALIDDQEIWIAEGQPDALAALSAGLPATGIPGVWGWHASLADQLADRDVIICTDADLEGRAASKRIAADLVLRARTVRIVDPDPRRHDGYDLTDLILADGMADAARRLRALAHRTPPAACGDSWQATAS